MGRETGKMWREAGDTGEREHNLPKKGELCHGLLDLTKEGELW